MKLFFLITIFSIVSFRTFAQFDYRIYQSYSAPRSKQENVKLTSITELQLKDNDTWAKTSFQEFNSDGLPVKLIQFNDIGQVLLEKDFLYNSERQISNIETYENKKHRSSTEFELRSSGQIDHYTEYVYSSYDGKKILVRKTFIDYYPNQLIKKTTEIEHGDTTAINLYNASGDLEKSLWEKPGLRTTKIEYKWNRDKTEMREDHYENPSKIYSTVMHRYKNNKEIEKIDASISSKPFYWKYDSGGRIIETNEAYYYVLYYSYDQEGKLIAKTINVLFSDSSEKNLPKKIYFKYIYKLREQ